MKKKLSPMQGCPKCKDVSVKIKKRLGYRIMYCINKGCGWSLSFDILPKELK